LYREHQELRSRIFKIGERVGRFVFVDEEVWERDLADEDCLAIADYLIRKVREAKVFICILGGSRHGDPIRFDERDSSVSFLEIELFQAALLRKPIHLFVLEGFSPEPGLAGILEVLRFALPNSSIHERLSELDLEERVSRILQTSPKLERQPLFPLGHSVIRKLVQTLYFARAPKPRYTRRTDVLFLNGSLSGGTGPLDEDLVVRILRASKEQRDEELRLARIWLAIRELMKCTPDSYRDPELLVHWNMALDQWASAAGWYGLHGHLYMGALAAFNSMAKVRKTLRENVHSIADPNAIRYPGGQLASARYSIAKRLYGKAKDSLLKEALDDANIAIRDGEDPLGSTLSVRAAIHRARGDIALAVQDFEEVLRRREQAGAGAGPMGVALSNLGYAYIHQRRLWLGRDLLEKGVELLEGNFRTGFLARAKHKLAIAYFLTGRPLRAYEERREARRIAQEYGAFDQV
jgi:tetratricopeptide (TPR) repeat protein